MTGKRVEHEKKPFHGGTRCARCTSPNVVGLCDAGGEELLPACERHVDRTIRTYDACIYCNGPVRKGSALIDGQLIKQGLATGVSAGGARRSILTAEGVAEA